MRNFERIGVRFPDTSERSPCTFETCSYAVFGSRLRFIAPAFRRQIAPKMEIETILAPLFLYSPV